MISQPVPNGANNAFVDIVSDAKSHIVQLILWPCRWQQCHINLHLNWQVFEFNPQTINAIPTEPGVYAFLIQPRLASNLDASYLMYIGKTDRPLRDRYQEYLQEIMKSTGRPKIAFTLSQYYGFIYFSCAPVVNQPITPANVEDELLKAFMPPMNDQLPAEVRRIVNAF